MLVPFSIRVYLGGRGGELKCSSCDSFRKDDTPLPTASPRQSHLVLTSGC